MKTDKGGKGFARDSRIGVRNVDDASCRVDNTATVAQWKERRKTGPATVHTAAKSTRRAA